MAATIEVGYSDQVIVRIGDDWVFYSRQTLISTRSKSRKTCQNHYREADGHPDAGTYFPYTAKWCTNWGVHRAIESARGGKDKENPVI